MRQFNNQHSESSEDQSEQASSQEIINQEQLLDVEVERIKQQLKNMPYQLILKQKQTLEKTKTKYNKEPNTPKIKKIAKKKIIIQQEKHQKNQAVQISIHGRNKRKYTEIVFQQKRKKAIDPRFQSFAGNYNPDLAMKSFNFIPKLQQAEINELKGKLKGKSKRNKLTPHQRQILTTEYNKVTSDYKRAQLLQLQKQTKKQLKQKNGQEFYLKKNEFKQEFQKKKLQRLSQGDREKKLKEKDIQMRRNQLNERRKSLHMHSQKPPFN